MKSPKCYWCGEAVDQEAWHHATFDRVCCRTCYVEPGSNYRKTYGPDADSESERVEVLNARRKAT